MPHYRMHAVRYTGPLWIGALPHPDLLGLLTATDLLVVMRHGDSAPAVVLGVPHQAAVGVERIAEDESREDGQIGRASDEGAALYALAAYERLLEQDTPCKLVIAAHATDHDPNKAVGTPYCQEVFADPARLLFECHGAGIHRPHALELSAGTNSLSHPSRFGELLAQSLLWRYTVVAQQHPCSAMGAIIYPDRKARHAELRLAGLKTESLRAAGDRGMHALHLEARPCFRISSAVQNALPAAGRRLGDAIASACIAYLAGRFLANGHQRA